ncbi:MAG: hypothetical protein ACK58L_21490 [Planctomycetota bacterium]
MENATYGSEFLQHLKAMAQTTPYHYEDLQKIKTMTQQELAEKLSMDCQPFAAIILSNDPKTAARLVHQKTVEMARGAAISAGLDPLNILSDVLAKIL